MLLRSNDKNRSNPATLAALIFYEMGPKMEETERAMEYACEKSFSKGESVGFSKGEFEGFKKTAINLKRLGFDAETIAAATGLALEEIINL